MTSMSTQDCCPERVENAAQERIGAGTHRNYRTACPRFTLKPLVVRLPSAEWSESARGRRSAVSGAWCTAPASVKVPLA